MRRPADTSAWGNPVPHFITVLANEVQDSNRAVVARRLGVSRSTVSLLLDNKYPSPSTAKMEARIMDVLGGVRCPQLGDITQAECQKHRKAKFVGSNPAKVALYRACQRCPHNKEANAHAESA